jgi:hypothetical protein
MPPWEVAVRHRISARGDPPAYMRGLVRERERERERERVRERESAREMQ